MPSLRHADARTLALAAIDRLKPLELPVRRWVLRDRFRRIEVETSSRCNRRCYYCPVAEVQRPDHLMDEALFWSIVDQLAEMRFRGVFSPHFYGEPLLDPRLPRLVAGVKERLRGVMVEIYTNGDALTPKKARELLDAGVGLFLVTLEEGEPPALAKTRASLDKWTWRRHFLVRSFDEHVPSPYNRGGTVLFPGKEARFDQCLHPAASLVVDAWGKVKLCANDYVGEHDWGDLNEERLADVWARPDFKALRYELLRGEFRYESCRVCSGRAPAPAPLRVNATSPPGRAG